MKEVISKIKALPKGFNPVLVVWRATLVGMKDIPMFESFLSRELEITGRYLGEYKTKPTKGVKDTGGRNDVLFAVQGKDIPRFAMTRLQIEGMSWLEDVVVNEKDILPSWVLELEAN